MTTQTVVLPYERSNLHIPRRDLVLTASDSLTLTVRIVERDDPSADALDLTGGLGGPGLQMQIWTDRRNGGYPGWDYGRDGWDGSDTGWLPINLLAHLDGTISPTARGTFDMFLPPGCLSGLPRRCEWAMLLTFDGRRQAETLAQGSLHVRWIPGPVAEISIPLMTDNYHPILTDMPGEASAFSASLTASATFLASLNEIPLNATLTASATFTGSLTTGVGSSNMFDFTDPNNTENFFFFW